MKKKGNWVSLIAPNQEMDKERKYTSAEQPRTSRKTILSRPLIPLQSSTYLVSRDIPLLLPTDMYSHVHRHLYCMQNIKNTMNPLRIEHWRNCQMGTERTEDGKRKKNILGSIRLFPGAFQKYFSFLY